MTNLYEEGLFGEIPSNLIVERIRTGETDRQGTTLFTCELLDGFNTVDDKGIPIKIESSQTLYIDEEKIDCEISSEEILYETLGKVIYNYYTLSNERFAYFYLLSAYYIEPYNVEEFRNQIANQIRDFLFYDYLRMKHYKNNTDKTVRNSILKERTKEIETLEKAVIDYFSPKSVVRQDQANISGKLDEAQKREVEINSQINELKKQIAKLEREKEEIEISIHDYRRSILTEEEIIKAEYDYEVNGDIEYIEYAPNGYEAFEFDRKKYRDDIRTSQKAHIEEFKEQQEFIRQELENAAQEEESSIPEEIQRKARYFLDKGYIKEEKGHYVVANNFTGQEIAWINKYKLKDLGKNYFRINEMALYIWKNETEPYKKSNFTSLKTPNKSIED